MDEIVAIQQLISNVGFPIFVAIWLLWRSDAKEEKTQSILTEIKEVLAVVAKGGSKDSD